MEVQESTATDWKPVDLKFASAQYPQPNNPHLPRHCSVAILCGARQSGKTFALCEWIKTLEQTGVKDKSGRNVPIRTILISPTAQMNPVYQSLQSLAPEDIHSDYSDEMFLDIVEDMKAKKEECEKYEEDLELYKKMLKMRDENDLTFEELMRLSLFDFQEPTPPEIYPCPITHLIFDDVVGSSATRDGKKSPVINFTIKNRHHLCQVYYLVQNLKSIPKAIRSNANVFMLYPFSNSKMIAEDIYPEVSNLVREPEFMKLYEYATQPDESLKYPFLMIDFTKPKAHTFRKGFNRYLAIKRTYE